MIDKIINAICIKINETFGDGYEIYTETVEQGLKEPCFSVLCVEPSIAHFIDYKYFKSTKFCIHFFPDVENKKAECIKMADKLFDALEYIKLDDGLIRGTEMSADESEGVLHFFVNYDLFIYKNKNELVDMGDLTYNLNAKE